MSDSVYSQDLMDAWQPWHTGCEKMRQGTPSQASGMPPGMDWILGALDVLEKGTPDGFSQLQQEDLPVLLDFLARVFQRPPDAYDPTAARAQLKRMGVKNAPFPMLDFLRMVLAGYNRPGRKNRPPALVKAAQERPVLAATLSALSTRFPIQGELAPELMRRCPRLHDLWRAAAHLRHHPGQVREYLTEEGLSDRFPASEWPDLDSSDSSESPESLVGWLADPTRIEWSPGMRRELLALRAKKSAQAADQASAKLLACIQQALRAGAVRRLKGPLGALLELTRALPETPTRGRLVADLEQLWLRVLIHAPGITSEEFLALWNSIQAAPTADRAWIAAKLMQGFPMYSFEDPGMQQAMAECMCCALHTGSDSVSAVHEAIEHLDFDLDDKSLERAVSLAPVEMRSSLRALLAATFRPLVDGIRAILLALRADEMLWCSHTVRTLAQRILGDAPGSRSQGQHLERGLAALMRALAESEKEMTPERFLLVQACMMHVSRIKPARTALDSLKVGARAALNQDRTDEFAAQNDRLKILWQMRDTKRAQAELREYGRWLRRAPSRASIRSALRAVMVLASLKEVTDAWERSARSKPSAHVTVFVDWLRALTRWLDGLDQEQIVRLALQLGEREADSAGLHTWFRTISSQPMDPRLNELQYDLESMLRGFL